MTPSKKEFEDALIARHGKENYEKFKASRVAVCGLGGLGSNVAVSLARAGVGYLHLIDFDTVDISNLNRQHYFVDQIGMAKTEALDLIIKRIAPFCYIKTDYTKVTDKNIYSLLEKDDIVVEAFDSAEEKAVLVNGVLELFSGKPVVSGSGMAGFESLNLIKTRRIGKRLYICGDETSDVEEEGSLFAPRVMSCAAHEAMTVLRLISGITEP